ncbi:hypothetical protein KAH55_01660 [bacterium]|nr:hypothetical protein [bacterium]
MKRCGWAVMGLVLFLSCGPGHEEIAELEQALFSAPHAEKTTAIQDLLELPKLAYDGLIPETVLDSLTIRVQDYQQFLTAIKPEHKKLKQVLNTFQGVADAFQRDLQKLTARKKVYDAVITALNSMNQTQANATFEQLSRKEQVLRESINTQFVIKRTIFFLDEITRAARQFRADFGILSGEQLPGKSVN